MKYTAEQKSELKKKDIDKLPRNYKPKPKQFIKDGFLIIESKL